MELGGGKGMSRRDMADHVDTYAMLGLELYFITVGHIQY
jgi:hypothetical protein